jgi:hypothetical protein
LALETAELESLRNAPGHAVARWPCGQLSISLNEEPGKSPIEAAPWRTTGSRYIAPAHEIDNLYLR